MATPTSLWLRRNCRDPNPKNGSGDRIDRYSRSIMRLVRPPVASSIRWLKKKAQVLKDAIPVRIAEIREEYRAAADHCNTINTKLDSFRHHFSLIKQRFDYHFMGVRQTNRIDKPEWYFTQILNWAKENHVFVGEIFQSAANRACITENTRVRFSSM